MPLNTLRMPRYWATANVAGFRQTVSLSVHLVEGHPHEERRHPQDSDRLGQHNAVEGEHELDEMCLHPLAQGIAKEDKDDGAQSRGRRQLDGSGPCGVLERRGAAAFPLPRFTVLLEHCAAAHCYPWLQAGA